MILIDTCVWIDHLHTTDDDLVRLLTSGHACTHPMVIGEVALGCLRDRSKIVRLIGDLPAGGLARDDEVHALIDQDELFGRGLGWIDAHLLAAVLLVPGTRLWTRDRALAKAAESLRCAWSPG